MPAVYADEHDRLLRLQRAAAEGSTYRRSLVNIAAQNRQLDNQFRREHNAARISEIQRRSARNRVDPSTGLTPTIRDTHIQRAYRDEIANQMVPPPAVNLSDTPTGALAERLAAPGLSRRLSEGYFGTPEAPENIALRDYLRGVINPPPGAPGADMIQRSYELLGVTPPRPDVREPVRQPAWFERNVVNPVGDAADAVADEAIRAVERDPRFQFVREFGPPAFEQANQRVFEPSELVGGRIIQGLGESMAPLGPYQGGREMGRPASIAEIPEDVRVAGEAMFGGEEAGRRQSERLREIPLPARIAGGIIFDPTNLIPGIGFVDEAVYLKYIDDVKRLGELPAIRNARRTIEETGGLGAQPGRLLRGEQGGTQLPSGGRWRRLGQQTVPDVGTPERPVQIPGGPPAYRRNGFWIMVTPQGEFNVTDPLTQNRWDAMIDEGADFLDVSRPTWELERQGRFEPPAPQREVVTQQPVINEPIPPRGDIPDVPGQPGRLLREEGGFSQLPGGEGKQWRVDVEAKTFDRGKEQTSLRPIYVQAATKAEAQKLATDYLKYGSMYGTKGRYTVKRAALDASGGQELDDAANALLRSSGANPSEVIPIAQQIYRRDAQRSATIGAAQVAEALQSIPRTPAAFPPIREGVERQVQGFQPPAPRSPVPEPPGDIPDVPGGGLPEGYRIGTDPEIGTRVRGRTVAGEKEVLGEYRGRVPGKGHAAWINRDGELVEVWETSVHVNAPDVPGQPPREPPTGVAPEPGREAIVDEGVPPETAAPPGSLGEGGPPDELPPTDLDGLGGMPDRTPPPARPDPRQPKPGRVFTEPTTPYVEGNRIVPNLLPFGEVTSDIGNNKNVMTQIGATLGVDPQAVLEDPLAIAGLAVVRQRLAARSLVEAALADLVRFFDKKGNLPFRINRRGQIKNIKTRTIDQSTDWLDVVEHHLDYEMTADQHLFADAMLRLFREDEAMRRAHGLKPRGPEELREVMYVGRKVKKIKDAEVLGRTNPGLQRHYELAADARSHNIVLENDPIENARLRLMATYEEIIGAQLKNYADQFGTNPMDLVPESLKVARKAARSRTARTLNAIRAVQRALRGERLPTGTIDAIYRAVPDLKTNVYRNSQFTLDDLIEAGERTAREGRVRLSPVSPSTIKKYREEIEELEAVVAADPKNAKALEELNGLKKKLAFARYRTGEEMAIREANAVDGKPMSYGEHLEREDLWYELERSPSKMLLGDREKFLKAALRELRGEQVVDEAGKKTYEGGALQFARAQQGEIEPKYASAVASAKGRQVLKPEELPGGVWDTGDAERISVRQWSGIHGTPGGNYFPAESVARMEKYLKPPEVSIFGKAASTFGSYLKLMTASVDFAAPGTHGMSLLGENPVRWGKAAGQHYYAFLDPAVQARFFMKNKDDFVEMARHGVPISEHEFFQAITAGGEGGVSLRFVPELLRASGRQVGKQTFGRFHSSYDAFLAMERWSLWDAYRHLDPWERADLVKNATGGMQLAAKGIGPERRAWESVLLAFSPMLLRSTVSLVGRAATRGPGGAQARKTLGKMVGAMVGAYVTFGIASGRDQKEILDGLNPLGGKKFLSYKFGDTYYGLGGQLRALAMLGYGLGSVPAPGGKTPEDILSLDVQRNPVLDFWSSRGAPIRGPLQATAEFVTGENYDPYRRVDNLRDYAETIAGSFVPFSGQAIREGQPPQAVLFGSVGGRASMVTPYEKLEIRYKEDHPGEDFSLELMQAEAQGLIEDKPPNEDYQQLLDDWEESRRARGTESALSAERIDNFRADAERSYGLADDPLTGSPGWASKFLDGEPVGPQIVEANANLTTFMAGVLKSEYAGRSGGDADSRIFAQISELQPKSARYIDQETNEYSWDLWEADVQKFVDNLSETGKREYETKLLQAIDPKWAEVEPKLRAAKEARSALYDEIVPVRGLTSEGYDGIQDFYGDVRLAQDYWKTKGNKVGFEDAIRYMAQKQGRSGRFLEWALALRPGSKTLDLNRNPDWDRRLVELDKELDGLLQAFYPELYPDRVLEQMYEASR